MDLDSILWLLLLLAFYLLPQLLGGKKRGTQQRGPVPGQAPQPGRPDPQHRGAETTEVNDWEDALQQIREALGAPPPPEPRPAPRAEPERPTRRLEPEPVPDFHRREPPREVMLPDFPTASKTRLPEKREIKTRLETVRKVEELPAHRQKVQKPLPLPKPPLTSPAGKNRSRSALVERLRRPDTARDAVLLSEILGPRRGLGPRR